MNRNQRREELKTIRTQQRAPITEHRLKKRLEFGETEKAISGEEIPQYDYPTKSKTKKTKTISEDKTMLTETSPYTNLDFEEYPYPTEKVDSPKSVKDIGRTWMDYEYIMGQPSRELRARAEVSLIRAERLKREKQDFGAGIAFSTHYLESVGSGFWDVATLRFRPYALAETATAPVRILSDPELQREFGRQVSRDPMGFIGEVTGGMLGGIASSELIGYAKSKYGAYKTSKFLEEYPAEKFFVLEERIMDFPEAVDVQKVNIMGLKERTVDTTSHSKFGAIDESARWGEIGEGGPTLMPKGVWSKKYDIWKKGGTAVTKLKETPEYVKEWVPIWKIDVETTHLPGLSTKYFSPEIVSGPSYYSGIMGGFGAAFRFHQPTLEEPIVDIKTSSITEIRRIQGLDRLRKTKEDIGITNIEDFKETTEEFTIPIFKFKFTGPPIIIQKTKKDIIQKQKHEQEQNIISMIEPIFRPIRTTKKIKTPYKEKKKRIKKRLSIPKLLGYETKRYPIPTPEELLGIPTRKSRKRKTRKKTNKKSKRRKK